MICKNCGNYVAETMAFCTKCGTPIEKKAEVTESVKKNNGSKKGLLIGVAAVVVVAVIVISIFVSGFMSTKEMRDALETNNAYLINEIYSRAWNDPKLVEKYDELITEKLDNFIEDINSQDFTEQAKQNADDDFEEYIYANIGDFLDELNFSDSIYSNNYVKWEELFELIESKEAYYLGVHDYATGKYESAVDLFALVSESDSNFDSAKNFISDSITEYISVSMEEAQALIASGDISGGIELLTSAKEYIDNLGIDSTEINDKINSTLSTYASQYAEKAEAAFNEQDIDSAIGNIEVALELQPDNADYTSKYNYYLQFEPFKLYEQENMIIWDTSRGDFKFYDSETANDNIDYYNIIKFISYDEDALKNTVTIDYTLDGKYDIVTGKMFICEEYKNSECVGYFEFYGDGKLLHTTDQVTRGVYPADILVDVSGVHKLTVKFYGKDSGDFNTSCYVFVSDLVAQKAFPEQ